MLEIKQLLKLTIDSVASDLHLLVSVPPTLRIDGRLRTVANVEPLTNDQVKVLIFEIMTSQQKELFLANKEIDFSYAYENKGRFRINAYFEKGNFAAALRLIPVEIKTIEELSLPEICHSFASFHQGFVLVTGPTGHGKSSTLAAIINEINKSRDTHIITIEDPIEYIYKDQKSIISQREVHQDTHSWQVALRSVLREDPDVVLVGEMRDYETIAAALTIAETGHLVFATLHTNSAAQTIDRVVDVFPEHQQPQVRMQLANTLAAIISQRLLPAINGGRVPVTEILLSTAAVKTNIREGKSHMIDNIIQTSREIGMMTLDDSLAFQVKKGKISLQEAKKWSLRPVELARLVNT